AKLGFKLNIEDNTLTIVPSTACHSNQTLQAEDLRAAAVLLIAALQAPFQTIIKGIHHLTRGYDFFIENLRSLGANICVE
ncbi:MAG: UDP-N-acetylglucosamine 1-carboxyvinyltransferase, partial [Gammaproteobacteria bacterium]|nr:UDP-N-acetylglucosamine 1-carboxyvinyltransferase [Gammaproteobacteria bacterium]